MAHRRGRGVRGPPEAEGRGSSAASGSADGEEAENRVIVVALGNVDVGGFDQQFPCRGAGSSWCVQEEKKRRGFGGGARRQPLRGVLVKKWEGGGHGVTRRFLRREMVVILRRPCYPEER